MIDDPSESTLTLTFAECGSALLRVKRAIRRAFASRASWVERLRLTRRALARLRGAGGAQAILSRRAIGAMYAEARVKIHEADVVLREGARILLRLGDVIDHSTTIAQRCELLGVNQVDRHALSEADGFMKIVVALALEGSAEYRNDGGDRGPLFRATWPLIVDQLCALPRGRLFLDARLERDGALAAPTRYRRLPDGPLTGAERAPRVLH